MSEEKSEKDPFAYMVEMYDNWAKAWAKTMSETASSPRFVESMSRQMEGSLEFWSLVRSQVSQAVEQMLQGMNLPTQSEIIDLADRLTHIEMRLDDIEDKLDQLLDRSE